MTASVADVYRDYTNSGYEQLPAHRSCVPTRKGQKKLLALVPAYREIAEKLGLHEWSAF
jgi:hypothetical protein